MFRIVRLADPGLTLEKDPTAKVPSPVASEGATILERPTAAAAFPHVSIRANHSYLIVFPLPSFTGSRAFILAI